MVPRKSTYKRTCSQVSHMLPGLSFSPFQGVQQDQERNAEVLHVEVARVEGQFCTAPQVVTYPFPALAGTEEVHQARDEELFQPRTELSDVRVAQ